MLQCSCGPRRWQHAGPTSRSYLTGGENYKNEFQLKAEYLSYPLVEAELALCLQQDLPSNVHLSMYSR